MENFVKRMIVEHKELCERIGKLEKFLVNDGIEKLDKAEFAAGNVQLSAMKTYAEALAARLFYHDIVIIGDRYCEDVNIEENKES